MIHQISFSIQSLLDACVAQASIDFSALRASQPDIADAVYADYTLTSDREVEFREALSTELAYFASLLNDRLSFFSDYDDRLAWGIDIENRDAFTEVVSTLVFSYFKYRMLAWWFSGRNDHLQLFYSERAESAKRNIMSFSGGIMNGRTLRHF